MNRWAYGDCFRLRPGFAAAILACAVLWAQTHANSLLSLNYPLGLPLAVQSGMGLSMGGASCGVADGNHVMMGNPANLGTMRRTAFSSLISADFTSISDRGERSTDLTMVPRQFSLGFPVGILGAAAVAMERQSLVEVKYRDRLRVGQAFPGFERKSATLDSVGLALSDEGGITSWQGGWGRSVGKHFSVGMAYERLYFSHDHTYFRTAYGTSFEVGNGSRYEEELRDSVSRTLRANGIRGGVMFRRNKATVGVSGRYVLRADLVSDRGVYFDSDTVENRVRRKPVTLPPSVRGGGSYSFSERLLVAADVEVTVWDRFDGGGLLREPDMSYALSAGGGLQFIPAPDLLAPQYWETIRYRTGGSFAQLPFRDNREARVHVGLGLPLKGHGLLDVVISAGRRWDDRYEDYSEDLLGLSVGVNGGRRWSSSSSESYD